MGLSLGLFSGSFGSLSSRSPPGPPLELSSGLPQELPSEQPPGCYRGCLTPESSPESPLHTETLGFRTAWPRVSFAFRVSSSRVFRRRISSVLRVSSYGFGCLLRLALRGRLSVPRPTAGDWRRFSAQAQYPGSVPRFLPIQNSPCPRFAVSRLSDTWVPQVQRLSASTPACPRTSA